MGWRERSYWDRGDCCLKDFAAWAVLLLKAFVYGFGGLAILRAFGAYNDVSGRLGDLVGLGLRDGDCLWVESLRYVLD